MENVEPTPPKQLSEKTLRLYELYPRCVRTCYSCKEVKECALGRPQCAPCHTEATYEYNPAMCRYCPECSRMRWHYAGATTCYVCDNYTKISRRDLKMTRQEYNKVMNEGIKCPDTGIRYDDFSNKRPCFKRSLDRIDNNRGYELDNVRVCSFFSNRARNDLDLDDYKEVMKRLRSGTSDDWTP